MLNFLGAHNLHENSIKIKDNKLNKRPKTKKKNKYDKNNVVFTVNLYKGRTFVLIIKTYSFVKKNHVRISSAIYRYTSRCVYQMRTVWQKNYQTLRARHTAQSSNNGKGKCKNDHNKKFEIYESLALLLTFFAVDFPSALSW